MNHKQRIQLWLLGVFSIFILLAAAMVAPIPQPTAYHQFADQRDFFGIPNFFNVASNLALLVSGLAGVLFVFQSPNLLINRTFLVLSERTAYLVLFLSVIFTCFGSAYYHWMPDNERLLWDRLPIAIGITALLAITLSERISLKLGLQLLPWLVISGVASVWYWYWSEQQGIGNLNYYIVTQFYSLLLIILIGIFFPSQYTNASDMHYVIVLYGLAKIAESLDQEIYNFGQVISGHTLKHLLAALAVYWIVRMLRRRCLLIN